MTNFSMDGRRGGDEGEANPERWARVTAMSQTISRVDGWTLLCECPESASVRPRVLALEAATVGS
jgi:hypothetical protein